MVTNQNVLLAALPREDSRALAAELLPVPLDFGEVLYEAGAPMRDVYFPSAGLVSLVTIVDRTSRLEVGMVGREGVVGVALALGVERSPVRALVQGAGTALRMTSAHFAGALHDSPALRRGVHGYIHALMQQITRTAACNRFHVVEARLARWLLMTRDRVGGNEFRMTHEFLSSMLGIRRAGVTQAAVALQRAGLIEYTRGRIRILDRRGLEAAACSCYAAGRKPS
jgi:CRP-like cAMP-binding protein